MLTGQTSSTSECDLSLPLINNQLLLERCVFSRPFFISLTLVIAIITRSLIFGDTGALYPMEVYALRLKTSSKNLTARIQVIDQTDVKQSGAVDLVELLRREANLQVRSTSGNSTWECSPIHY